MGAMAEGGRVAGKIAIVVGGGQTPGATVGNGRATAVLLAREGAKVLVADRDLASADETAEIRAEGGTASTVEVDVTDEPGIERMRDACLDEWGRVDILHNNVGIWLAGGDASILDIDAASFSHMFDVNLRGMALTAKHILPVMRAQRAGVITNVGSIAALMTFPTVAYKTTKAGVATLTEHIAIANAEYGIRANVILPGLIDTPMAVEHQISDGSGRDDIVAGRMERVPLKTRSGRAWDVAYAALYLASDEAGFVTGVSLRVDGGQTLLVG
jgi:NAD(P)-dependent dehydrogenase (short-subunit alcohol dehydrogenase family)